MKVRCIANNLRSLDNPHIKERLSSSIKLDGTIEDIRIGNLYSVYAMSHRKDGGIWIYLNTVPESDYPYPYPMEMFEIVDGSIPSGWAIGFGNDLSGTTFKCISFSEWVNDSQFYEKLVEGDEIAVDLYEFWKGLLP